MQAHLHLYCLHMSLVARKPVFGICDQVRLKPSCSATQTKLEAWNLGYYKQAEVLYYPGSEQQRHWSDCADAQANLRLCCSHMAWTGFLMRRLILWHIQVLLWSCSGSLFWHIMLFLLFNQFEKYKTQNGGEVSNLVIINFTCPHVFFQNSIMLYTLYMSALKLDWFTFLYSV